MSNPQHSNMCPTTSLLHRCTGSDADNVAILGATRCVLLATRGVVLCDVSCSLAAEPTVALELSDGLLAVGDAAGGVWFLRLGVHTAQGVVARLELPHQAPSSITALTHLEGWGGFPGALTGDELNTSTQLCCNHTTVMSRLLLLFPIIAVLQSSATPPCALRLPR